ncbi:MAG: hypothetical protein V2I63_08880 [Pseudomonadales bacterium]|jgi:hypothetical protein|nr:hypothetical protein [Pseudomonadales bacterium]
MRPLLIVLFALASQCACAASLAPAPADGSGWSIDLPLEAAGRVDDLLLAEMSGLVASRRYPGVLWAHNDSGSPPALFALNERFETMVPPYLAARYGRGDGTDREPWPGIALVDASNIDWEDIARIDDLLYLADTGNNGNARRDLGFWELTEPVPDGVAQARPMRYLGVHYPEQQAFPGRVWEWDCEAVFSDGGVLYLITKHRTPGDVRAMIPGARLYRFDPATARPNSTPLTLVSRHEGLTAATGADLSPDGRLLAVLTYSSLWLFPRPQEGDDWLAGRPWIQRLPLLRTRQAEAITWLDDRRLLIGNEEGALFTLEVDPERLAAAERRGAAGV